MYTEAAVIGGGAAGFMAAVTAKANGLGIIIMERKDRVLKKVLATGNGRCNVSNRAEVRDYPAHFFENGKFLYKSLHIFSPVDLEGLLREQGVTCKEEDGGRIFPTSEKAKDVVDALFLRAKDKGVSFHGGEPVLMICKDENERITKVVTQQATYDVDACVICTGGKSYPATGSTGDGYSLATMLGHKVIPVRPALAQLDGVTEVVKPLQGVCLSGVLIRLLCEGVCLASTSGDMIFTHFGFSGPGIFRLSRFLPTDISLYEGDKVCLSIDLWAGQSEETVTGKMKLLFTENQNKKVFSVLRMLWSEAIVRTILNRIHVEGQMCCRDFTRIDRNTLLSESRDFGFVVRRQPLFSGAMVTRGGIALSEVDPKTLASKIVSGLFFAGEVLDIDGETGGYNLQAAFSTGFSAGASAAGLAANRN